MNEVNTGSWTGVYTGDGKEKMGEGGVDRIFPEPLERR